MDVATRELVSLTENHGAETVEEADIDELLKWTNGLNYDKSVHQQLDPLLYVFTVNLLQVCYGMAEFSF